MKILYILGGAVGVLALVFVGVYLYVEKLANPRVYRELVADPDGVRGKEVMALTLPSGRRILANYLREGDRVYAGADGTWWKELVGDGHAVTLLVRGETLSGTARAVRDDPDHRKDVFSRLRPNALPGFGTLVEIRLDAVEEQS